MQNDVPGGGVVVTNDPHSMVSRKVWVGECRLCKKETVNCCNVCQMEFYCCNKHAKDDAKSHKKDCSKRLKELREWKKNKALDLLDDVLAVAARVFRREKEPDADAAKDDLQMDGTWSAIPMRLEMAQDGGKLWFLKIRDPQDPQITLKEFETRGFTREHFQQIECLGKASMYNSAMLLALQELAIKFDSKFVFAGEQLSTYSICNVTVESPCPSITVNYPDPKVEQHWKTEQIDMTKHQVLLFNTEGMGELFIDFAAPQFGVHQNMVPNVDMPIWICPFEKQRLYKAKEKIFAGELRKELESQVKDIVENKKTDFYPAVVLRYSQIIVQRVILGKMRTLNKLHRPASARQVLVDHLSPALTAEYNKKVQNQGLDQNQDVGEVSGCMKHEATK